MKKTRSNVIVSLVIAIFLLSQCVWAKVEYHKKPFEQLAQSHNKIPHIAIPDFQKITLKNGITIYLAEDHDAPIILTQGMIRWGAGQETIENAGISDLMITMMNTGTRKHSEPELSRYKKRHAIGLGLYSDYQTFGFNGNALRSEAKALIGLTAEMLRQPKFNANYFQRIKDEREKSLKQQETEENSLLNLYFYRNIIKSHPYAWNYDFSLQLANLPKMTPRILDDYYKRAITPDHTILFVYGDFKTEDMKKTIIKYFGGWARREIAEETTTTPQTQENPDSFGRILLVDKADATQAKIKMGYRFYDAVFLERNLENSAAFQTGNQILGGGDFGSFLMDDIRSQKGYVYDIGAGFSSYRSGGAYYIQTSVRPDKAYETVDAVKQLIGEVQAGKRKITPEKVFQITNRNNAFFPESYRFKEDIIYNLIDNVEINNRGADYLNQYIQAYNQVTAAKAQEALSRYLFPEKLFTVIVGKKEAILPQFQEKGMEVTVVNP